MANSSDDAMQRITRLESNVDDLKGAVVQIVNLLIEQGERMDARMERIEERMDGMNAGFRSVTDRLDRLIAVSMQERTSGVDRLAELERRVEKLERNAGI
jgi:hypothetical protein